METTEYNNVPEEIVNSNVEVLNDLLRINNDRIEGYKKAIHETNKDQHDLHGLFASMIEQSQEFASELSKTIASSGNKPASDTTVIGKFYRAWMDVKTAFTGSDRKSILESCERGEDAAQHAYNEALKEVLQDKIYILVNAQKDALKASHDKIKYLRDLQRN